MWKSYFLSYAIQSPIFLGYNTFSGIEKTRYYIPPPNMLGAFIQEIRSNENTAVSLKNFKGALRFSTFFLSENGRDALYPMLEADGNLVYGEKGFSLMDFTEQFISTKESLRYGMPRRFSEMEFITPKNNFSDKQNFLVGYLYVDERKISDFDFWMRSLQKIVVGDEVSYNLGRLSLIELKKNSTKEGYSDIFSMEGASLDLSGNEPLVSYVKPLPLLSPAVLGDREGNLKNIYGIKEIIEGRKNLLKEEIEYQNGKQKARWVPGTLIYPGPSGISFKICSDGVWHSL